MLDFYELTDTTHKAIDFYSTFTLRHMQDVDFRDLVQCSFQVVFVGAYTKKISQSEKLFVLNAYHLFFYLWRGF